MAGSFRELINRQRIKPLIWDYSFIMLRTNIKVFGRFVKLLPNNSKTLDVGCGFKPWASLLPINSEYIGLDYDLTKSSADVVGTSDKLPFADSSFDALIYSEVLEHVDNLPETLREMKRVIKPGGIVFISTPFMFPEHGAPHDYQRLTRYYYKKIFSDQVIELNESNSSFSTVLVSLNLFIETTPFRLFWGIKQCIYIIINILSLISDYIIDFVLTRIGKSYRPYFYVMPLGYALILKIEK